MRITVCFPLLAVLAGCSVVPQQAWTFDPTRPQPRMELPAAEAAALTDRVAQLQLRRNEIRAQIAGEPDIWKRQRHYARLHEVGMDLSALERRLATVSAR
jgi:hypothetical protein